MHANDITDPIKQKKFSNIFSYLPVFVSLSLQTNNIYLMYCNSII